MKPSSETNSVANEPYRLGTWARIYLHGFIASVVVYGLAYVVMLLVPMFDFTGSRAVAIALSMATILIVPPLVGSLILFGVLPLLGKKEAWRGVTAWDDRLFSQLFSARQKVRIVIVNWPSREVRTLGVLTATLTSKDSDRQLAAVYVPTAPQTRLGYIRVVSLDEVEFTDWTLRQWQMYQLTFGSVSPNQIRDDMADE